MQQRLPKQYVNELAFQSREVIRTALEICCSVLFMLTIQKIIRGMDKK